MARHAAGVPFSLDVELCRVGKSPMTKTLKLFMSLAFMGVGIAACSKEDSGSSTQRDRGEEVIDPCNKRTFHKDKCHAKCCTEKLDPTPDICVELIEEKACMISSREPKL